MKLSRSTALLALALPLASAEAARLGFDESGAADLSYGDDALVRVRLAVYGPDWDYLDQDDATELSPGEIDGGSRSFAGGIPIEGTDDGVIRYDELVEWLEGERVDLSYRTTVETAASSIELCSLALSFYLAADHFAGIEMSTDEGSFTFPVELDGAGFASWTTEHVALPLGETGETLAIDFAEPVSLGFQDNRYWMGTEYELRASIRGCEQVEAGATDQLDLAMSGDAPLEVQLGSVEFAHDTSGWVEFALPYDQAPVAGSAVDVSALLEARDGSEGFLCAVDEQLEYGEVPGAAARFWGTNLSAGANFPDHDEAELVAERLQRFGVDLVRHHHMDASWSQPSLIDYDEDCRSLDADALDRLDYLVYQLRLRGIASYLDLLVHRTACEGDGIEAWEEMPAGWKGYATFDAQLIELQKEYATQLLTHENPYTGLRYADDPGVVLMELANENDLYSYELELEPYASQLTALWLAWLAKEGLAEVEPREGSVYNRFLSELQSDYYQEMIAHLRSLGVQIPVTGTNWSTQPGLLAANGQLEFTDSHAYWDHPTDDYTRFQGEAMVEASLGVESTTFGTLAFSSVPGRPCFVSEWGHPWPTFYRAEGPLWMAATAALQGWDGVACYSYRHGTGEVDSIEGPFESAIDPAIYALFPTASLLYRRGDLGAASARTVVQHDDPWADRQATPAYTTSAGGRATRTWLVDAPGLPPVSIDEQDLVLEPGGSALDDGSTVVTDPAGQLWHDFAAGVVLIDTAMTQAALGMLGGAATQALGEVEITVDEQTPFAVVAVTSVAEEPIASSERLLVTAVARVENSGQSYLQGTSWQRDDDGSGPTIVEPVHGELRFSRSLEGARAWRLDPLGERQDELDLSGGVLSLADGGFSPWIELVFEDEPADSSPPSDDSATSSDSGPGQDTPGCGCGTSSRSAGGAQWWWLALALVCRRRWPASLAAASLPGSRGARRRADEERRASG